MTVKTSMSRSPGRSAIAVLTKVSTGKSFAGCMNKQWPIERDHAKQVGKVGLGTDIYRTASSLSESAPGWCS